ncbi:furin-like protease 2 [Halyomorpha halys]|uniref:furin-like protease 2 n=1 Tax=Halyomorpha halys TaxID=286706 RepID=UPI0006D4DE11
MNVRPAWSKGYTGKGVVVSILDDGIQTNHPDLAENYDPAASTDINDNDDDPMPRDNGDNKHGTRCAGEVAAVAYNSFCGIGVAYNASIGGVRMLDGSVNDAVEARALSLNPDHIDIYSASWGPEDDGKTVDGPGPLARRAFINGVTTGRKGKGSIFVWASGNGGRHTDSCNCDGYTNSIFTLSISSATQGGYKPWYLEECSSTLATTYSSGTPGHDKSIATVDMDGKLRPDHICTVEHTGTSASAPLASGLCALALEANPELTWRDMQHIVVMTSNPEPLMKEAGWITNGVNRKVSHKFGYGLMDGGAMVSLAEQWTSVPPQHICKSQEVREDRQIDQSYGSILTTAVDASGCTGTVNEVRFVEHVQCKISLRFFPRGNLRIVLTSPSGTPSTLLMERPRDVVSSNFDDWPFLSVHYWGENPTGRWTLHIINAGNRHVNQPGILRKWQLIFYGTVSNPVRLRRPGHQISFPSAAPASLNPIFQGSQDFFSGAFRHLPNIFTAAGSETKVFIYCLRFKIFIIFNL